MTALVEAVVVFTPLVFGLEGTLSVAIVKCYGDKELRRGI